MFGRIIAGIFLCVVVFIGAGCDQIKPLKMPTDTTKEGPGLFSGEKGNWDLSNIAGVNQDKQKQTQPSPCPVPEKKRDLEKPPIAKDEK